MSEIRTSLFRLARSWPPDAGDYRSLRDKGRPVRPPVTSEKVEAWAGLSAYDSAERAREIAEQFPGRWWYIVRYDLPTDGSIRSRPTFGTGHHTIWATKEELEPFLAPDFRIRV